MDVVTDGGASRRNEMERDVQVGWFSQSSKKRRGAEKFVSLGKMDA